MRLHASLREALTDLSMHSSSSSNGGDEDPSLCADDAAAADDGEVGGLASKSAGLETSPAPLANHAISSSGSTTGLRLLQAARLQQNEQAVPPGALWLDDVEAAAAAGPIGGTKAAYVAARLLASAAWKQLGFEADPLSVGALQQQGRENDRQARVALSAGEWMAEVLLSSGGFLPSHHTIIHMLGGSAQVLQPVVVQDDTCGSSSSSCADTHGQLRRPAGADSLKGAAVGEADESSGCAVIVGWCPSLSHSVYQDVELM